jgi:hypothetical protein
MVDATRQFNYQGEMLMHIGFGAGSFYKDCNSQSEALLLRPLHVHGPKRENKYYYRSRKSFPLKMDKVTPINKADSIFDEIKSFLEKYSRTTRRWLSWI